MNSVSSWQLDILSTDIQIVKAIYKYAVINAVFGMLETQPKLCQCDGLTFVWNFLKIIKFNSNAFKSTEYNFQLFFYRPIQSLNVPEWNICFHLHDHVTSHAYSECKQNLQWNRTKDC